jgi:aspartate carbamoyltransferase catalytic subunit
MAVLDWLTPGGDFPKQESYAARQRASSALIMP